MDCSNPRHHAHADTKTSNQTAHHLLVRRLRAEVHVGGQHRDVRVGVHPPDDPRLHARRRRQRRGPLRGRRQLLAAHLHAVLPPVGPREGHHVPDLRLDRLIVLGWVLGMGVEWGVDWVRTSMSL